jgi:hypothetical protein
MSKNRGKSKLSKNVLFNANKHVFHCEKSLGTLFYGQPSYMLMYIYVYVCLYVVYKAENTAVGIRHADHVLSTKVRRQAALAQSV